MIFKFLYLLYLPWPRRSKATILHWILLMIADCKEKDNRICKVPHLICKRISIIKHGLNSSKDWHGGTEPPLPTAEPAAPTKTPHTSYPQLTRAPSFLPLFTSSLRRTCILLCFKISCASQESEFKSCSRSSDAEAMLPSFPSHKCSKISPSYTAAMKMKQLPCSTYSLGSYRMELYSNVGMYKID